MSHSTARTDLACRNCGNQAPLKFCPECGQETTLHPPTLGEFLHEFVGHYVALEGALWRTLRLLVTRPGRLTREYLDGRRRKYVLPLRLYLSCSFLLHLLARGDICGNTADSIGLTRRIEQRELEHNIGVLAIRTLRVGLRLYGLTGLEDLPIDCL